MTADRRARRPLGTVTRGTTNPNRLRRVDRWITATYGLRLRHADRPLVVDLGYGASGVTTAELFTRLRAVAPRVEVVGIEIDPARVAAARRYETDGLSFRLGGFELPVDRPPTLIRAFNVLRQYDEADAWTAWRTLTAHLAPNGVLVEGTCDEIGRRAVWVALPAGTPEPVTVTFAAHLASLNRPSDLAERLPKTLIHRNTPGEPVHHLLTTFDRAWATAAPQSTFGPKHRWITTVHLLARHYPLQSHRARQGEVTLPWSTVAPR